jgi:RsiW-degrading membrane proteinase PrsW (M82 family)
MAVPRPDPERTRRIVGGVIYGIAVFAGLCIVVGNFILGPLTMADPEAAYEAFGIGALCALPPLAIYIWIPRLLDRFDPEPWWALALVVVWGAFAACGVALVINSGVGMVAEAVAPGSGQIVMACFSAPIVEEGMKGLGVLGVFYFLRREFDGVVDGVIYATFTALGFATIENVLYYGRAAAADSQGLALAGTFALRGILTPWLHPLFTSMTGLGFGIARETDKTWLRWLAPIGGYCAAVFLHCVWNSSSAISGLIILVLPLFILFMLGFVGLLIGLVVRKGRIIRMHLQDEVMLGNLTREEMLLATSAFGGLRAGFSWGGAAGRRFVRAAARLALCKWHAGRAMRGRKKTVSIDWIVPLRQELFQLRNDVARALGRPVPQPQAWVPQPQQAWGPGPQQPQAWGPAPPRPPYGWGR